MSCRMYQKSCYFRAWNKYNISWRRLEAPSVMSNKQVYSSALEREIPLQKVSKLSFFSYCHLKISTSSWTEASLQRKVKLLTASIVKPQTVRGGVCTKTMSTLSTVRCVNNRTVWRVKRSMPTWTAKNIKMISKGEHRMTRQRGKHNSFLR